MGVRVGLGVWVWVGVGVVVGFGVGFGVGVGASSRQRVRKLDIIKDTDEDTLLTWFMQIEKREKVAYPNVYTKYQFNFIDKIDLLCLESRKI